MNLRRFLVLCAASMAVFTMGGEAMAAPTVPAGPDRGSPRALELELPQARTAAVDGSRFTPRSPLRVLDTRSSGAVPQRGTITLDLSGRVPEATTAVVLNLTGVSPTLASYVTVWPAEASRPTVSNLNLAAREIRSNAVTVALGPSRQLKLYNHNGSINLVADLAGHYATDGQAAYNTRAPKRILDTRSSGRPIPAGGTITVNTAAALGSSGAKAVTINLTVVNPTVTTYLTAFPTGVSRPNASSISVARGTVTANQVTVAVGATDRNIRIYNNSGNAHVLVDVVGHYDINGGDEFYPIVPIRAFDSRSNGLGKLRGGYYYPIAVTDDPYSEQAKMTSLVFNVTGTGGTAATYLTVYPIASPWPNASTVNLAARQTAGNTTTTGLGWESDAQGLYYGFNVYNHAGYIDVVLDWAGYFQAPTA